MVYSGTPYNDEIELSTIVQLHVTTCIHLTNLMLSKQNKAQRNRVYKKKFKKRLN